MTGLELTNSGSEDKGFTLRPFIPAAASLFLGSLPPLLTMHIKQYSDIVKQLTMYQPVNKRSALNYTTSQCVQFNSKPYKTIFLPTLWKRKYWFHMHLGTNLEITTSSILHLFLTIKSTYYIIRKVTYTYRKHKTQKQASIKIIMGC